MKTTMGENIRRLRRERNMTQEELAGLVGVSFQAVSKWETGAGLPDLGLVPRLARIFDVTTDELFAYDRTEREAEVERICQEASAFRFSDPAKSRTILEEGLKEFPEDEILQNNILYVIDYEKNPDEMVLAASRLADRARQDDVRYDALRFLSYAYKVKGDLAAAEAALEQIPEIYFTKLEEVAHVLTGQRRFDAARSQKWIALGSALEMMGILAEEYAAQGRTEDAATELARAGAILDILRPDGDFDRCGGEASQRLRRQLEGLEG